MKGNVDLKEIKKRIHEIECKNDELKANIVIKIYKKKLKNKITKEFARN